MINLVYRWPLSHFFKINLIYQLIHLIKAQTHFIGPAHIPANSVFWVIFDKSTLSTQNPHYQSINLAYRRPMSHLSDNVGWRNNVGSSNECHPGLPQTSIRLFAHCRWHIFVKDSVSAKGQVSRSPAKVMRLIGQKVSQNRPRTSELCGTVQTIGSLNV